MATDMVSSNGIELCYETRGPEQGEPMIFIMGLSAQMVFWPEALLDGMADRGYRVIAFDNRDVGQSTTLGGSLRYGPMTVLLRRLLRLAIPAPYTLDDMVADTVGLMDALEIDKAHLVGASMGGMIAQLTAATRPDRVRTLTSIMSSTNSLLPLPKAGVLKAMTASPGEIDSEEQYVALGLELMSKIGGTLDQGREELAGMFRRSWQRGAHPQGVLNQSRAIMATGNFAPRLSSVRCPVQVVHGTNDPLIPPAGGQASARALRGARFTLIDGMGHDLPPSVVPYIAGLIALNAERGDT